MWCAALAGDRGYRSATLRASLADAEIEAVIPKRTLTTGRTSVNACGRAINRSKGYRAEVTRYDKLAAS